MASCKAPTLSFTDNTTLGDALDFATEISTAINTAIDTLEGEEDAIDFDLAVDTINAEFDDNFALRLDELTGLIDAMTGGFLTTEIERRARTTRVKPTGAPSGS